MATVHDTRDVLFGGHAPEPDDHLLEDLRLEIRETASAIGMATDGDADTFGIVGEDGKFVHPTASSPCSLIIWLKRAAGKMALERRLLLPI